MFAGRQSRCRDYTPSTLCPPGTRVCTVGADEMDKLVEAGLPLMLLRIPNPAR